MPNALLFPRDILRPNQPDDHFAAEAEAARTLGIEVALLDHDAIVAGDIAAGLRGVKSTTAKTLYRGWMLTPAAYGEMAVALANLGLDLVTSADQYRGAHQLPFWFPKLTSLTPESIWTTSSDIDEFLTVLSELGHGSAVIKDYSKSEKDYWDEAMFIPDVADREHARAVAVRFRELRGDAFDSGFVIRRFEKLSTPEARTWWRNSVCVGISSHPDSPESTLRNLDLSVVESPIETLGLPFVTADIALRSDTGATRIVEIGDGQVSDRPASYDASEFIAAIADSG